MIRPLRITLLIIAWLSCALGFIGIIAPVLPTTPFLLLATFLFARCSPRAHAWIISTKAYRTYVAAFKKAGGMPASTKARILAVSYVLMGISAYVARKPMVYVILGCAAAFLLYLVAFRIPTIQNQDAEEARTDDAE